MSDGPDTQGLPSADGAPAAQDRPAAQRSPAGPQTLPPEHHMDPVERTVHRILQSGIVASVALLAVGLLLSAVRGEGLPESVVPTADLLADLAHLDAAAYLSLGLMVLIATPFVRVGGSIVTFARQHDRRYVIVTSIVLAVMLVSVLVGRA